SQRLARLLIPPWATAGAQRACSVGYARAVGTLLTNMLRCPPVSGGIEPVCAQHADRRHARTVRALTASVPGCSPDASIAADARTRAKLGTYALACNASGVPPAEAVPCVTRRRRQLVTLVRRLAVCHVGALERSGRPDDPSCTRRALDRWMHRAQRHRRGGCPVCVDDTTLGQLVDRNVTLLLDRTVPMPVAIGQAIYLRPDEEPAAP